MSTLGRIVTVGVLSASQRLRRAWGIGSLVVLLLGLALMAGAVESRGIIIGDTQDPSAPAVAVIFAGLIAYLGGFGLFLWLVAGVVMWIGRIIGEDTGLIERRPVKHHDDAIIDNRPMPTPWVPFYKYLK
jgi:hypothetical protein